MPNPHASISFFLLPIFFLSFSLPQAGAWTWLGSTYPPAGYRIWLNNLAPCHKDLTFTYRPIQQYPHRPQIAGSCTATQKKRAVDKCSNFSHVSFSSGGTLVWRDGAEGACLLKTLLWTGFMAYLHKQIWAEWMAEALCLLINMRANSVQCKPIESVLKASYLSAIV